MFNDDKNDEIDEVVLEHEDTADVDDEIEAVEDADEAKATKIRKQLKACNEEKMAALEELQRSKADFLNARRRLEEGRIAERERNTTEWIESLLPLCDSFHMAMSNKTQWEAVDKNWRIGIEGIHNQLQTILKNNNVESYDPTGELFDPNLHEALSSKEDPSENDTILSVLQLGYKLNDTIIRPAKVIISS
jgi:molecular chaperone GrpE